LRLVALARVNPGCGQTEGWILSCRTAQSAGNAPRVNRQELPGVSLAQSNFDALQKNAVSVRLQFEVVTNMDRRNEEADFLGEFFTDATNTTQQFPILRFVDQRN